MHKDTRKGGNKFEGCMYLLNTRLHHNQTRDNLPSTGGFVTKKKQLKGGLLATQTNTQTINEHKTEFVVFSF